MGGPQNYTVFGRQVGSHILAVATLSSTVGGIMLYSRGSKKGQEAKTTPPINASSKEEEAFINEFLKNAEAEAQKAKQ